MKPAYNVNKMQTLKKNKKFISNIKLNNLVEFDDVRMPE